MSIKVMTWVWDNSPSSGTELLLELALADHCDDSGRCWPSVKRLATKARTTERHVTRLLTQLVESGRIARSIGAGPNGTNVYMFRKGEDNPSPPTPPSGGTPGHQGGEPHVAPPVTPASPKPSLEPSLEPSSVSATAKLRTRLKVVDFEPTPEQRAQYLEKFPDSDISLELERFNDYQHANGHGYIDHHRAFLNWLRSPFQEIGRDLRDRQSRRPRRAPNDSAGLATGISDVDRRRAALDERRQRLATTPAGVGGP